MTWGGSRVAAWVVVALVAGCSGKARDLDAPEGGDEKSDDAGASGAGASGAGGAMGSRQLDGGASGSGGTGGDKLYEPPMHDGPTYDGVVPEPHDPAAFLWDQSKLRTFELRIAPEDMARIDADPRAEEYVPGTLIFDGNEYAVGVRYKGSIGAFRGCVATFTGEKTCTKLSMKVAFDHHDEDARFYGLRKLQFHAMNRDPSMLKERLGYALFREFGIAAPRAVHARLVINGTLSGLYALIEQIDGRFTRSRFSEGGKGNLYKEAWPVDVDNRVVAEPELRMQLETNEDENPSLETMLGFGRAIEKASLDSLSEALSAYTDLDYTMSYVAVDRTIAHDDGPFHWYCAGGPCYNHNFYWYEALDDARLWIVTWDLDHAFNLDNTTTTLWFDWDDGSRGCEPQSQFPFLVPLRAPTCDKLTLGWARMQRRYLERVEAFLEGPFDPEKVEAKLKAWEEQIAGTVADASVLHFDAPTVEAWADARAALRSALATLLQRARDRLERGAIEVLDPRAIEPPDAGMDAGSDAGVDGGSDAGIDAGIDAGMDGGIDAGPDSESDPDPDADGGA